MDSNQKNLLGVLDAYRWRSFHGRLGEAFLLTLLCAGLGAGLVLLIDRLAQPAVAARGVIAWSLVAAVALTALRGLSRLLASPRDMEVALAIEAASPLPFHSTLITAIDQPGQVESERRGTSASLVLACQRTALEVASKVDVPGLVSLDRPLAQARLMAAVALLWALAVIVAGPVLKGRLVYRYAALVAPALAPTVTFGVTPGSTQLLSGERLVIAVTIRGVSVDDLEAVDLDARWSDGTRQRIPLTRGPGPFTTVFAAVSKALDYRVVAGPFESATYHIAVVEPPRIESLELEYQYPEYTRLSPQKQAREPFDITGPAGTRVTFRLRSTKPLKSATVKLSKHSVALNSAPSSRAASGVLALTTDDTYTLEIVDVDGFAGPASPRYSILVAPDRVPRVFVLEPGKDLSLAASEVSTIPLKIDVADEHGIDRVVLRWRVTQKVDYSYSSTDEELVLARPAQHPQKLVIDHPWDLTRRILQAGDSITYFVEAHDGLSRPAAVASTGSSLVSPFDHVGVSRVFTLRVPFGSETMQKVQKEEESQIASVEDVVAGQKALEEKVEKVLKEVRTSREIGYKEKKELENIVNRQKAIKDKAQDVAQRMEATLQTMQKSEVVDPGSVKKLAEIQKLFSEVADSKMKENMERMREMMQGARLDPSQLEKAMKDFDRNKYSKELDAILKNLKRLKAQQDLDRVKKTTEELIAKQEDLRSQTAGKIQDKKETSPLAEAQEELARKAEQLSKPLEKLAKEMKADFPETAAQLEELAQEARTNGPQQDQHEASESLKKNEGSKAYQKQSNALSKMQKLSAGLSQSQEQMKSKQMEIDLQSLVKLVGEGLDISEIQGELLADPAFTVETSDPRRLSLALAATQYSVSRATIRFERDFGESFPDDVTFKAAFLTQLSQLVEEAQEAKRNYEEGRLFSGKQLSRQGLARLNMVLAKLLEAMDQLKNQQSGQGMNNFMDQLQKMAERQRKLNDQTRRLQHGNTGDPAFQQMLQQMAAEQELIRQAVQEMAAKHGGAEDVLGDLEKLGQEMKEVEDALRKYDNSERRQERQDRIATRMLDYSKSLTKQGQTEGRQAEASTTFSPRSASALPADLTEARQRLHENMGRDQVPARYRRVVEEYFSTFGP